MTSTSRADVACEFTSGDAARQIASDFGDRVDHDRDLQFLAQGEQI